MIFKNDLPINPAIPEIRQVLNEGCNAVLQAPPGAGKTTLVPLALMHEPWLRGRRIIMLEPRRLAARAAAMRMAGMLGEKPGQSVGYRTRMDSKVGPATRIEVLTEGILTRFLQSDPSLEGVGLLIFDEFHERSLHADLGLALALESQSLFRGDLRILIMSATLDGEAVSSLLGGAPIITSEGQSYPVETRYLPVEQSAMTREKFAAIPSMLKIVKAILREEEGDILFFLPGTGEIRRVEAGLRAAGLPAGFIIAPLYGDLPKEAQEQAILPSPKGMRKVVLATSIAETSLTIEGIRIVIDSGLMRSPRFSPGSGMSRLETLRVTKASADQRRGRAGRLEAGICYRLWPESDDKTLLEQNSPEIRDADLSPLALELALWGAKNPRQLKWLDCPPKAAMSHAMELLKLLEAVDDDGNMTSQGRKMAELPLHPRLARMVLKGKGLGLASLACDLAALISERDMVSADPGFNDSDLRLRAELLRESGEVYLPSGLWIDRAVRKRNRQVADQIRKRLNISAETGKADKAGLLLALAYPDRIAKKRPGNERRYSMANGRGAYFPHHEPLSREDFIVAVNLDGQAKEARIFLAAPASLEEIEKHFHSLIFNEESVMWNASQQAVMARRQRRLMSLILRDEPLTKPDESKVGKALIDGINQRGVQCLPWDKEAITFQSRVNFLHRLNNEIPDLSNDALMAGLEKWLLPWLEGMSRLEHLRRLDMKKILLAMLTWEQQQRIEALAPTHILVPSGSRIPIDYENPKKPVLAVRLQEMFGLLHTPTIAEGKVRLSLHLLSPARRPIQVTEDLASFWARTYFDVKKDLKGRYPKHYWPEDPLQAKATNRAKSRRK